MLHSASGAPRRHAGRDASTRPQAATCRSGATSEVKEPRCEKVSIGGGRIVVALFGDSTAAEVGAETKKDPSFVWPRNSQFNCRGILIQDEGTYQLKPDEGMLTWCDAEIAGGDKGRVLDACTVGDSCEIKGIIRGHGAFGWVKITSVRSLKQERSAEPFRNKPLAGYIRHRWTHLNEPQLWMPYVLQQIGPSSLR